MMNASPLKIAGMLLLAFATLTHGAMDRPNILFIMTDDLGWRDLGSYGSELYQTPHLDALAQRGVRYSNAYSASPLCSPTRASILTGQAPGRLHLTQPVGHLKEVILNPVVPDTAAPGLPMTNPQSRTRLPLETVTIAQLLRNAGYRTAFMGKWHLGFEPYIPENFGYDTVVGGRGFPGPPPPGFFGPWDPEATNMPPVDGRPHADDVLGDAAVRFLRESRETGSPFFLSLWFYSVHAPFQAKDELIEKYRPLVETTVHQKSAIMGAMVETLDDNVGKVLAALEELGLAENTLVVFTSDNGGNMYDRPEGVNPTSNHPLRAGKGNNHEGGVRIPLIVSWPGKVAEGKISDAVTISYDWFPTLLEAAGLGTPSGLVLDGISILDTFDGSPLERPPIYSMFGRTVKATGNYSNMWVRDGRWKLLRYFHTGENFQDEYELYDLDTDPGEKYDLASARPAVVDRLRAWLDSRVETDGVLLPKANPLYNPDQKAGGWRMMQGGYIMGNDTSSEVHVVSSGGPVIMSLDAEKAANSSDVLEFTLLSNCVSRVTAGDLDTGIFGISRTVVPDRRRQVVRFPLPGDIETETFTVFFELSQPGFFILEY
jgi:arylsulfatase A-like enzyme